jgi:uncharacterized protein
LAWIRPGENRLGSGAACEVALRAGMAPERVGTLRPETESLILEVQPGVEARLRRTPITEHALRADNIPVADVLEIGRLSLIAIIRGRRWRLRVCDRENPRRRNFPEREWFPIRPDQVVQAVVEHGEVAGWIRFELQGIPFLLAPFSIDDDGVFLAFVDCAAGTSTYPRGRFLHSPPPEHGRLTLDFNRAYNPPWAFTQYATCPLPPAGNRLCVEIAAAERLRPDQPSWGGASSLPHQAWNWMQRAGDQLDGLTDAPSCLSSGEIQDVGSYSSQVSTGCRQSIPVDFGVLSASSNPPA